MESELMVESFVDFNDWRLARAAFAQSVSAVVVRMLARFLALI
jgi:hypothetical protein